MSTPPPPLSGDDDHYPGAYGEGLAGYQGAPGYYGGSPGSERDNNLGVIALVTGIISLIICQPLGVVAIVYGHRSQAAQAAGTADNGAVGTVGFWLGVAALVIALLLIVLTIALVAIGALSLSFFFDSMSST